MFLSNKFQLRLRIGCIVLSLSVTGCTVIPGSQVSRVMTPETVAPTESRDIFGIPLGKKLPEASIEAIQILITPALTDSLGQADDEKKITEDVIEGLELLKRNYMDKLRKLVGD